MPVNAKDKSCFASGNGIKTRETISSSKFHNNIETLHSNSQHADHHDRSDDFSTCIAHKLCSEAGMLFWHDAGAQSKQMHSGSIRRSGVYGGNEYEVPVDCKAGRPQHFQTVVTRHMRMSDSGILKNGLPW